VARIRTIKPEIWVDEKLVECSFAARLLFIGLLNFADDDGRMEYRPKKIKMQIFPADDVDISGLLGEIRREKLVIVYEVDNKEYLQIKGFQKHQKVDKRSKSKHPAPEESRRIPPNPADGRDQGRDQGMEEKEHMSDSGEPDDGFETLWREKPKRPNQSKPDARKAYNARIRDGIPHADLLAGLRRYNEFCRLEETEPRYCKHLATFLGPGEHWKKPWKSNGKVPTDEAGIMRLVQSENIQLAPNCPTHEARKAIAKQLGMAL